MNQHFNTETSVQKPDSCRCFDMIQIGSINDYLPCPSRRNYPKVIQCQVFQQCVIVSNSEGYDLIPGAWLVSGTYVVAQLGAWTT